MLENNSVKLLNIKKKKIWKYEYENLNAMLEHVKCMVGFEVDYIDVENLTAKFSQELSRNDFER